VGTHLLEGRLDRPTTRETFDHLLGRQAYVGREEIFVAVGAGPVVYENPRDLHQTFAGLIPVAGAGHHFDVASPAAIPSHVQTLPLAVAGHDFFGRRQPGPFDAGSTSGLATGACRRRRVEIGIGVETTDQRQARRSPRRGAGQLVRA